MTLSLFHSMYRGSFQWELFALVNHDYFSEKLLLKLNKKKPALLPAFRETGNWGSTQDSRSHLFFGDRPQLIHFSLPVKPAINIRWHLLPPK